MKNFKKIGTGLAFAALVMCGGLFLHTSKALAVTSNPGDINQCLSSIKFTNVATLECTFTPIGVSSPTTLTFTDNHPDDGGDTHAWKLNYKQNGNFYCDVGTSTNNGGLYDRYNDVGITVRGANDRLTPDKAGKSIPLVFNEGYENVDGQCVYPSGFNKDSLPNVTISGARTQKLAILLKIDNSSGIGPLDGVIASSTGLTNNWTLTSYQGSAGGLAYINGYTPGNCSGDIILVKENSAEATRYTLNGDNNLSSGHNYDALINFLTDSTWGTGGCGQNGGDRNFYGTETPFMLSAAAPAGPSQDNTPTSVGAAASTANTCGVAGGDLTWLFCPVMDLASHTADTVTKAFQSQLSFRLDNLNNNGGQDKTQQAWAIFRDLASAMLVIVMLVMVFSQAIGGGPFDAYTVRKMLPKLAVAIILIQISWYLIGWTVDLVDDIGTGIKQLMYLPFQPAKLDDYWNLLANAGIGTAQAAVTNWLLLIPAIAIGVVVALPMLLMFAFIAIMGVLTGLATLIFRQILIVLALMIAPVALIAWILPGTQRYFKLWSDNLIKALFMFPIVMALIAAGRIFAYVVGATGNNDFIKFFLVTVGFYGPLFLLPKAFKWGGQAMQMAGNAAWKANTKLQERPNKYFKERQEQLGNERRRQSQERVAGKREYGKGIKRLQGVSKGWAGTKAWRYPLDKFRSGQWDPILGMPRINVPEKTIGGKKVPGSGKSVGGSRRRFEKNAGYAEQGRESSGKTFNTAVAASQQLLDTAANHDEVARRLMEGGEFDYIDKNDVKRHFKPPAGGELYMRAAGAKAVNKYGTDRGWQKYEAEINRMRASDDGDERLLAEEILDDNVGTAKNKMEHLYRGFDRKAFQDHLAANPGDEQGAMRAATMNAVKSSVNSTDESKFNTMEPAEAQTRLATLSQAIAVGDKDAEAVMKKLWRDYEKADAKPTSSIAPGVHKAMKSYADENGGGIVRDSSGQPMSDPDNPDIPLTVLKQTNVRRLNEITDNVSGTIRQPDGSLINNEETIIVRSHPVLDTITNADTNNQRLITDMNVKSLTAKYDSDGSKISARASRGGGGSAPEVNPPDEGGGPGYRPAYQVSDRVNPSGDFGSVGVELGHSPVSRPTQPSEFGETEYGAVARPGPTAAVSPAATPTASAPASVAGQVAGSAGPSAETGSVHDGGAGYTPDATRTVERVTERTVQAVSPTIIQPTTVVQAATPQGTQTVYSRVPEPATRPGGSILDQQTAQELDYQLRSVYHELKKLGVRNQQQQQQFNQLKSQHPDWDQDDN